VLKLSRHKAGYPILSLVINGKWVTRTVHSLLAEAFIGTRPEGQQIRHLDGNHENCTRPNLEYGTVAMNQADRLRHGTSNRGQRNGQAILTPEQVREIRSAPKGKHVCQGFADKHGVAIGTVRDLRRANPRSWKYLEEAV
jgi:hypothetical protein